MDTPADERHHLDDIASRIEYSEGVIRYSTRYCYQIFSRYMQPGNTLELGPGEGVMTECLCERGEPVTVVDGAQGLCSDLKRRFPQATVVHSLFEEFVPSERYTNILLGHVLEHVEDPRNLLESVRDWLCKDGRVLAAVPNSRSLHRQAGVMMGLLDSEDELNETDVSIGHRRVYGPERFREEFISAGFRIEASGGYWIKTLTNAQTLEICTPEMLRAFFELGERYPDIAAEIYVVASPSQ